jgi:hypothetical protein
MDAAEGQVIGDIDDNFTHFQTNYLLHKMHNTLIQRQLT